MSTDIGGPNRRSRRADRTNPLRRARRHWSTTPTTIR